MKLSKNKWAKFCMGKDIIFCPPCFSSVGTCCYPPLIHPIKPSLLLASSCCMNLAHQPTNCNSPKLFSAACKQIVNGPIGPSRNIFLFNLWHMEECLKWHDEGARKLSSYWSTPCRHFGWHGFWVRNMFFNFWILSFWILADFPNSGFPNSYNPDNLRFCEYWV